MLGGALSPIGDVIAFIRASIDAVLDAVRAIHDPTPLDIAAVATLVDGAAALDPMEAPWTVELLVDCGEWTAYANNFIGGGDLTALAPAIAARLGVVCASAEHSPMHGPGHAATQLWLQGPDGEPVRTLGAICEDGRWSWHESGDGQWFETPERYGARRIRDRFDRDLLISYHAKVVIHPDDPLFFGRGAIVRQRVSWPRRQESVASWRQAGGGSYG